MSVPQLTLLNPAEHYQSAPQVNNITSAMPLPRKRSVSYASTCAVILIPSRKEYIDAGIDLWYNRKDQQAAQSQVANELKQLITFNPALTIETAMKFLYQPYVHLDSTLFDIDCGACVPLHMMVIDKCEITAKETSNSICQILSNYNKWNVHFKHGSSSDSVAKYFASPSGYAQVLDVVLVDESVLEKGQMTQMLSGIVNVLRSAYGFAVLIGVNLSNSADSPDVRECAVQLGLDFVWAKPLHLYVDMLPLMLASRTKQKATKERLRSHKSTNCLLTSAEGCAAPVGSPVSTIFTLQSPPLSHHHKIYQQEPIEASHLPMVM